MSMVTTSSRRTFRYVFHQENENTVSSSIAFLQSLVWNDPKTFFILLANYMLYVWNELDFLPAGVLMPSDPWYGLRELKLAVDADKRPEGHPNVSKVSRVVKPDKKYNWLPFGHRPK